jgi:hypothetical protein
MIGDPRMLTLSLPTASKAYNLLALLQAADPTTFSTTTGGAAGGITLAQYLGIQSPVGAGGANLYIGNKDVSAINCGAQLVASQLFSINPVQGNGIDLSSVWVLSDTAAAKINVTVGIL